MNGRMASCGVPRPVLGDEGCRPPAAGGPAGRRPVLSVRYNCGRWQAHPGSHPLPRGVEASLLASRQSNSEGPPQFQSPLRPSLRQRPRTTFPSARPASFPSHPRSPFLRASQQVPMRSIPETPATNTGKQGKPCLGGQTISSRQITASTLHLAHCLFL